MVMNINKYHLLKTNCARPAKYLKYPHNKCRRCDFIAVPILQMGESSERFPNLPRITAGKIKIVS